MGAWTLAIDFGTTSSSAAVANGGLELVEVAGAPRVPSAVLADRDGSLVAGDIAVRQGAGAPDRVERTPKRRIGDRVVVLGDQQLAPADLAAAVLRLLADEAIRRQGGEAPSEVRLTHPASWAGTRLGVLRDAASRAGLGEVSFVPEPVAAALHYADEQLAVGALVAVYDLGGGTFDTAVLRRTEEGFEVVGPPGGSDRLGGEDFDERLYQHVGAALAAQDGDAWEHLRYSEERPWVRANAALRAEVRAAKEALSSTADYTIYVPAPVDAEVRVTREELERLIAGDLERTVDELCATVDRAGVTLDDLAAVYLVGGSSRIPLITRLLADRLGRMPVTWGDPKAVVVLGAAAAGAGAVRAASPVPAPAAAEASADDTAVLGATAAAAPVSPEVDDTAVIDVGPGPVEPASEDDDDLPAPAPVASGGRSRRAAGLAVAALLLVVALVAGVIALTGDDDPDGQVAAEGPDTTTTLDPDAEPLDLARTFDPEGDRELVAERTFRFSDDGTEFRNETLLRNATAAPVTRVWFEVVPKELATTVDDVTWSIQPSGIVVEDPVVYFEVELAAGAELTLVWSTPLPEGAEPSVALLDELAEAHASAVAGATGDIQLATAILAAEGADVVDTEVPDGGSTGTTLDGGTSDGSSDGSSDDGSITVDPGPQPTPNSAPTLSVSNRSNDERQSVNLAISVSDPNGDSVSLSASGLPKGLSVSGTRIVGTIAHDAASVTTDRRAGIKSRAFSVNVVATDSKGAQTARQFSWTVRDTHRLMPNYIGTEGCGGCQGMLDIAAVTSPSGFSCVYDSGTTFTVGRIWRQSIAPNTIIAWGQSAAYWYWENPCGSGNTPANTPQGWP
jgi:actin-like ATPase involved in cell morphogenesis